ncbi:MAG: hypothetical protein KAH01_05950 [Caldisericia bacterium]|nr:hypothetical protein [Caldisericia bacterium]
MRNAILIIGLVLMLIIPFSSFASLTIMNDLVNPLQSEDPQITQRQIDYYKSAKGIDKPIVIRYIHWLNDAAKGDFGMFEANRESSFPLFPFLMIFLASLLSGIAALFVIKKPFVSIIIFTIAAIITIIASSFVFSFLFLLLAVFSYFGYKELKKKPLVSQP